MKILIRYLRSIPHTLWLFWGFLFVILYGFALLAQTVIQENEIMFDQAILAALDRWRNERLDTVADILDVIGGSYVLLPASVVVAIGLWQRRRRSGVFFGLAVLGAIGLNGLAKLFFERARPESFEALVPAEGYAFPSGHTMSSTAVALAVFFVVRFHKPEWQWPVLLLGLLFALAVGLSRSYLQVHYPSDVVAGWILSTAWVLGTNSWYSRGRARG